MNIADEFFRHFANTSHIRCDTELILLEDRNPIFIPKRHTVKTYAAQNREAKKRRKANNIGKSRS